jgi:hypothetical protein
MPSPFYPPFDLEKGEKLNGSTWQMPKCLGFEKGKK